MNINHGDLGDLLTNIYDLSEQIEEMEGRFTVQPDAEKLEELEKVRRELVAEYLAAGGDEEAL